MRLSSILKLTSPLAFIAAFAVPGVARAEDFSLHTRVGAAVNLNDPQATLYSFGPAMQVEPMFRLADLPADLTLAAGPTLQAFYFPRQTDNGQNAGLLWEGGGALRLQGRRDMANGTGTWSGTSPYLEVSALAANTGKLYRPAFDATLGLEGPLDDAHEFWLGTFISYGHVFQTAGTEDATLLNKNDVNIFQMGLSLSFDLVKPRVETKVVRQTVVREITPACPPEKVVAQAPAKLEFIETVYFDWDSNKLRWESQDKIDRLVETLKNHPTGTITVNGHASLDGQYAHNVALSARRAQAVVDYLAAHGVDKARLTEAHFGPDVAASKGNNKTQEGRERNRRVEFQVSFTINGN